MKRTVDWVDANKQRWAFTNSNAGSRYFEDYDNLQCLKELNLGAIHAKLWSGKQDNKQAEFLVEKRFPWELVTEIGVYSHEWADKATEIVTKHGYKTHVKPEPAWYY